MRRYTLIPGNLDVRKLVHDTPPDEIPHFTLEKMLEVIHLIYRQREYTKWKVVNGYVQIKNDNFFAIAYDYRLYLDYLIKNDIVLCDEEYRKAKEFPDDPKSFGFKFSQQYCLSFQRFDLSTLIREERRIRRKAEICESPEQYHKLLKDYPFVKYLDELDVDFDGVHKCLLQIQDAIISNQFLSDTDKERAIYKLTSYVATLDQFARIPSQQVIIDKTGRRLHSPLTRLKKELRYFLKYKGEHLISLDLKNSQPFFSLALLKVDFWPSIIEPTVDGNTKKGKAALAHPLAKRLALQDSNSLKGRLRKFLAIEDLYPELAELQWGLSVQEQDVERNTSLQEIEESKLVRERRTVVSTTSIMTWISREILDTEAFVKFRTYVSNGEIYEQLISELERIFANNPSNIAHLTSENILWEGDFNVKRKAVKSLMVRAMFAPVRSRKPITRIAFEMFERSYPSIHRLFTRLKQGDHRSLARLLQRIESFVLLKATIKAINRQVRPMPPLWTIHDSIITTAKYQEKIKAIMKQTIESYIGVSPEIQVESWADYQPNQISHLQSEPEDLFESEEI